MEDLDVRSALTAYVTEGEPPIGLDGDTILARGRRSRRTRLLVASASVLVVLLALGAAVIALPRQGEIAGPACPSASAGETREQIVDRLSCVVGNAVRSMLPPGAKVERLTIPGETPPADPFHLVADAVGDTPREAVFHMGVRVTDERGSGSVYFTALLGDGGFAMARCGTGVPDQVSCEVEQLKEGGLRKVTESANGVLTYRASLVAPGANIEFSANNSGVLVQKGVRVPVQRPEPALNAAQVRGLALTPGLG
ncbi:hypothetical protein ACIOD2_15625 [Amycolatopsis sp. NPDC088138]|uniref:hypothetical protein n=1 Tax=Amycolatopsis sp. NPDC088138 TaxID=3363938 RepID=UPI00381F2E57